MHTYHIDSAERARSPLGAHIRLLTKGDHGNMIHSTIPPGMTGHATRFKTIDEFWYILTGAGEIWRRYPDGTEDVTPLIPGAAIHIPLGAAFQYRNQGNAPVTFICIAMPEWTGDDECILVEGPWVAQTDPSDET